MELEKGYTIWYNLSWQENKMQVIQYKIAGVGIQLLIPFECMEEKKFSYFRDSGRADIMIEFDICRKPPEEKGKMIYSSDIHVFQKGTVVCIEHFVAKYEKPYAWLYRDIQTPEKMNCYILEEEMNICRNVGHLFQLIRLEQIFMSQKAQILHSSFCKWENRGILFTAPSGTGKSTQADLWGKYQNAEIINGDRAVIRKIEKKWTASGLPYAGSSDIFKNETCEIEAIIVLRQGKVNEIQKLRPAEAFKWIYSEVITCQWSKEYQHQNIDLILDLVSTVPVYLFRCLPDESAVTMLKNCLENER